MNKKEREAAYRNLGRSRVQQALEQLRSAVWMQRREAPDAERPYTDSATDELVRIMEELRTLHRNRRRKA